MDVVLHALSLLLMLCGTAGSSLDCASILPNSRQHVIVELGQNFTATCQPSSQHFTADDIKWLLGNNVIDKVHYRKVNATSVSVTLLVTSTVRGWLKCWAQKFGIVPSCMYGISLMPGYPPLKPENLTCVALQDKMAVSSRLSCSWDPGARDPLIPTNVTLHANLDLGPNSSYQAVCAQPSICTVDLGTFPVYMDLNVWVNVTNALGSVSSEVQRRSAWSYVKPNPPSDIQVLSEKNFSSSLLVSWKHPIDSEVPRLSYDIRYCQSDSSVWSLVPEDTQKNRGSYRISPLQPFTYYTVQMRCNFFEHPGYWSDWSANVTARTAEYTPKSRPDLWRVIQPNGTSRKLTLMWKDPVKANGKIVKYFLKVGQDPRVTDRHHLIVNEPEPVRTTHHNFSMDLPPGKSVFIQLSAANSAGVSPESRLLVQESEDRPGVESVSWSVGAAGLQLDWVRPKQNHIRPAEYLLQWEKMPSALQSDIQWQRVPAQVNSSTLTGNFEPFVRYNVSVYPIYRVKWDPSVVWSEAGRAVSTQVYTQQGAPHHGPAASVRKSKKNSAELTWEEIPLEHRRGFITNYTIFYRTGNTEHAVTVSSDLHRYNLVDLDSESDYVVHVMASTAAGSTNGSNFNFKTVKYDDGQVELIVVLVCLGFFFLSICICLIWPKIQVIKQVLWPQVPDPSDSSVAHWSPDLPMKTDMPKEDVSVVEVDMFDRKSLFEEDKVALPLKKDKYMSEEHSSGIGGSSCMSSPRHSVSDSDEADSGQTTASTVQYSSVVASGYKGQTPSHQPVFSRSESTQPLLDCEEPAEPLHSRNSYCKRGLELGRLDQESEELNADSPAFCPTQEEASSDSDEPSGSGVCYMAQQNGYRPQ